MMDTATDWPKAKTRRARERDPPPLFRGNPLTRNNKGRGMQPRP